MNILELFEMIKYLIVYLILILVEEKMFWFKGIKNILFLKFRFIRGLYVGIYIW